MKDEKKLKLKSIDLSPAKWIWYPSRRTLPNTFVLFRKEISLDAMPLKATGWISADSRYRFTVNGKRVQWGPAPCDPRWLEADPFDIRDHLTVGRNVIGVEVLYYGHGEGTWVMGKPGLLFKLNLDFGNGNTVEVCSDESWMAMIDRAHPPGQYKRWFLRTLQEEFDARLHPYGWDTGNFKMDETWLPAMVLTGPANKPSICTGYPDYLMDSGITNSSIPFLRPRLIPPMKEEMVQAKALRNQGLITWLRRPREWFEFRTPGSFTARKATVSKMSSECEWELPPCRNESEGYILTFEFEEQLVGWPYFTIDAPEGTTVELITQESHDPDQTIWLDTHLFSWTRFICKEGINRFETFDFESLRWLQLHVHNASKPVKISNVGVRRRSYSWPNKPHIQCSDPRLRSLFRAGLNTMMNNAQETLVDGMGRERQQYSGDIGHELHAIRYAFGEFRMPERFLRTYSEGLSLEGYFIDCWPSYDRMVRIPQRQMGLTNWGPILDHGIQFVFDNWYHYLETGHIEALEESYPRLQRFAEYLMKLRSHDSLLPVENLGVPTVWIDHDAYLKQRHKKCAFNLYASAMFMHALSPIAHAFGDRDKAEAYRVFGQELLSHAIENFWDDKRSLFINNLPWLDEEDEIRMCDRSLATAILFDQCPDGRTSEIAKVLADCPNTMGLSFPPNAGWRYRALARLGRIDVILREFREKWANLKSVVLNNSLQENWNAHPDSIDEWSHASVAPIYVLFMDIAGIRPVLPGFEKCEIQPSLGDIEDLSLTAHTVKGPIQFHARKLEGGHLLSITLPPGCETELLLPGNSETDLPLLPCDHREAMKRYKLTAGLKNTFVIRPLPNQ